MGATLDDGTLVNHSDLIGVDDRAQAMRNEHDSATKVDQQLFDGSLHYGLILGIQGRGCLVQKQQLGLPKKASRDSKPLPLPTGQHDAFLTHTSIISLFHFGNVLVAICCCAGFDDLLSRVRSAQAVREVFLDGGCKQLCVLRNETAALPDAGGGKSFHVLAVQKNSALIRFVEAHEHVHQGALASAALAHKGCGGGGRHVQVDALEDQVFWAGTVAELQSFQLQMPNNVLTCHLVAISRVNLWTSVDNRKDALCSRRRANEVVEDVSQRNESAVHHVPVQLERDQLANAHAFAFAVANELSSVPQNQNCGAEVHVGRERSHRSPHIGILDAVPKRGVDAVCILAGLVLLSREAAHRADVSDGIRSCAVRFSEGTVDRPVHTPAPLCIRAVAIRDRWHNCQG
mmetsp:Transcript_52527/g.85111  ORF Transcript_52527/g.85111 Transcript_52527/m.85111 type:complete len:402 (-) Transcript_52527:103-1308(-)